jgi:hypothetical protein
MHGIDVERHGIPARPILAACHGSRRGQRRQRLGAARAIGPRAWTGLRRRVYGMLFGRLPCNQKRAIRGRQMEYLVPTACAGDARRAEQSGYE